METVEQKIEETFKQMPKGQYPLAKAYALSEAQEFDNYGADWGNSKYDKIEAYKDLKQYYPEEVVKAVEKMVNDNTYTQSKDENKVYVANIVGILDKIEKQQSQNNDVAVTNAQQLTEKQFTQLNYLKNQVKYLGMGESPELHKALENAVISPEKENNVRIEYNNPEKLMKGNSISFDLHFNKSEQGNIFLNSYRANLITKKGEERSQSFKVNKDSITAKEAINLLEGRSVKIEHDNVDKETGELFRTESFIKLKLKDEKTKYDNYKYEWYNKGYGLDVEAIMQKSNLVFADDSQRELTQKHLEKGNITEVNFIYEKKEIKGFAILNPQYKALNLYDSAMNRLNVNKPVQSTNLENTQKNDVTQNLQHQVKM